MAFLAGDKMTADRLNISAYARYERQSGTQTLSTSTDTQVQFPTAVQPDDDVVPGGTNNDYFTFLSGLWIAIASVRISSSTATYELSIAAGSTVWTSANVLAANGSGNVNNEVATVIDARAAAVSAAVNAWQASGTSRTITVFGHSTSMTLLRFG